MSGQLRTRGDEEEWMSCATLGEEGFKSSLLNPFSADTQARFTLRKPLSVNSTVQSYMMSSASKMHPTLMCEHNEK